jgi:hypothetical protein
MSAQGGPPARQKAGTSALKTPGRPALGGCFAKVLSFIVSNQDLFSFIIALFINQILLHRIKQFLPKFQVLCHISPY